MAQWLKFPGLDHPSQSNSLQLGSKLEMSLGGENGWERIVCVWGRGDVLPANFRLPLHSLFLRIYILPPLQEALCINPLIIH